MSTTPEPSGAGGVTPPSTDLLLSAIVDSSDDAIVSKDLNGVVTSWNKSAERIFGYSSAEMVGRPILIIPPPERVSEEAEILARIRSGRRVDHFETKRRRKDGRIIDVSVTISPIRRRDGTIIGASKIARDITDLKRIAAEREQLLESERVARSRAEQASRMKDEFLATVSHELRTPLNAIVGWTHVLKDACERQEDMTEAIDVIDRNARMQAQLIDDLLDLGRITSGKMVLDIEWVRMDAIIREALASIRHAAEAKEITVTTVLSDVRGGVMGDKKRLQQVVWNLLSNAIKFTPKRGRVIVSIRRLNSHLEVSVADNGRGIAAEFVPYLFDRFSQADSSITRQHGGLGIGLALVKQLVELHGGEVRADSGGIGQGAVFTIRLPIVAASELNAEPSSTGPGSAPLDDLSGIRVLAVDDDRDSLEVVKRVLSARHAEVETASSAEEAIRMFPELRPHVLLSDLGMPEKDGFEFIRRIRQLPEGKSVPAAALTALARSEDRMRSLQAGFQTHLAKPVAPAELVAVVRSLAALNGGD